MAEFIVFIDYFRENICDESSCLETWRASMLSSTSVFFNKAVWFGS